MVLGLSPPGRFLDCPASGFGDALPGGVVLGGGAQAKQAAKVFHAPMGLAVFGHFSSGRRHHAAGDLHAQVLVQGHERQLATCALDDVAAADEAAFLSKSTGQLAVLLTVSLNAGNSFGFSNPSLNPLSRLLGNHQGR
jgi:hypothetical protein